MVMKLCTLIRHLNMYHGWQWITKHFAKLVRKLFFALSFPLLLSVTFCLLQDYEKFVEYVCGAYKGGHGPEACKSLSKPAESDAAGVTVSSISVCYADEASELEIDQAN